MPIKDGVINLDVAINSDRTYRAENTRNHMYTNTQEFHTWYVPVSSAQTVTMKANSTKISKGLREYKGGEKYFPEEVVVHYHVRNWYQVHEHQVFYIEDFFLPPPSAPTK